MILQPQPRIPTVQSQSKTDNFLANRVARLAPPTVDPVRQRFRRLLPVVRIPGVNNESLDRLRQSWMCRRSARGFVYRRPFRYLSQRVDGQHLGLCAFHAGKECVESHDCTLMVQLAADWKER